MSEHHKSHPEYCTMGIFAGYGEFEDSSMGDKASGDLVERLREESLQLARSSFDSVDAGLSANLCDAAIDEIESLRAQLAVTEAKLEDEEANAARAWNAWEAVSAQLASATKALEEIRALYRKERDDLENTPPKDSSTVNWNGGRVSGLGDARMILERSLKPDGGKE